jgi:glycogen debranching enzyme
MRRHRRTMLSLVVVSSLAGLWFDLPFRPTASAQAAIGIPRFQWPSTGLSLERPSRSGAFLDVVGRRSAFFGYEHRGLEAWVYPLKLVDDLELGFTLEGYPLEIRGRDILSAIRATPEATTLTYSHAAFTVRAVAFAPIDEPALVLLLDIDSTLPLSVAVSFRQRLRLMWPAGLQTGNIGWNAAANSYELSEESGRFAGLIGSPAAREGSIMPYQEEPRDVPIRFTIDAGTSDFARALVPIVITGSVTGLADARATYTRVLNDVPSLFTRTVEHYTNLLERTVDITTPDARLDTFYRWAKVGVDKGVAVNPLLGTGLIAGFRTSGESERPGFAWFFGRDAIWTTFALNAYGDGETTRTALTFLRKFQRADGKIPHEISQSASLLPWFTDYPYAWASADATPLYVEGYGDYWRASGDTAFVKDAWPSILSAWRFSAATDTDGNALIENTTVGHGWVEGGALSPPHEEIYLQGVWVEAQRSLAGMAEAVGDAATAKAASVGAERTRRAIEDILWQEDAGAYAYATKLPRTARILAEPGPNREKRQRALDSIADARLYNERTVLPAVPLWWRVLDPARADSELDSIGSGALATDWGQRILSNRSELYDPLSYHFGSVWPLFTGWASIGAYRYGRPHVGYQSLMANALLTDANALGYVTELLSGDFQAPFGRSSHHQVWSEAMVASPILKGLFGLERARDASGRSTVTIMPQVPADWSVFSLRHVTIGRGRIDVRVTRHPGSWSYSVSPIDGDLQGTTLALGVTVPADGAILDARVGGRRVDIEQSGVRGDVRQAFVRVTPGGAETAVTVSIREGSDVYRTIEPAQAGARNRGLRILRSRASPAGLALRLEAPGGTHHVVRLRSPRELTRLPEGVRRLPSASGDPLLEVAFEGSAQEYVRRDIVLPLR